ncbi:MAG: nickel pincer cofactor biosynthesis protein LarB [Acidimicrobiia bacterium]|nr:nickel pincer cofactor biosynthesis protein LarB [Acidimicrobiia bacterium]
MDAEARLDRDRTRRIDLPEAIYCQSKTVEQCVAIVRDLLADGHRSGTANGNGPGDAIVATRATPAQYEALLDLKPDAFVGPATAGHATLSWRHRSSTGRTAAVVAAGTSDLAVASECRLTLESLGHRVETLTDVGVAGLHRLLDALPLLDDVEVIVAVAGMEGALPTVLAGLVAQPIVAVPTSVGYGTAFEGQTALLSMMTSCAPGIAVVGIDNGYGAACAAHRMLRPLGLEWDGPAT